MIYRSFLFGYFCFLLFVCMFVFFQNIGSLNGTVDILHHVIGKATNITVIINLLRYIFKYWKADRSFLSFKVLFKR